MTSTQQLQPKPPPPPPGPYPTAAYPPGPPAPKKSHRGRTIAIIGTVVVVLIVIIAAASSGSKKKASTSSSTTPVAAAPAAPAVGPSAKTPPAAATSAPSASPAGVHRIGDTAATSGWQVTVYAVQDPWSSGDQFTLPAAGNRYVRVDVQVRNAHSDQQIWSSLAGFHVLDAQNRSYDEALVVVQPGPPEGQVAAGQAVRGYVTFEVPNAAKGLVFLVQGSFTAAGSRFQLS